MRGVTFMDDGRGLSEYLRQFNSTWFPAAAPQSLEAASTLQQYRYKLEDYLASRSSLENTSLLIALLTFVFLFMSWSSRIGSWGRFSPFGRNPAPGANQVSEDDYSYITSEDLKRAQNRSPSPAESGPSRDRDVLILKCKRVSYPVHFPAHSISRGQIRIGDVRAQAARETNTSDAGRIKLLYKGKSLKDDTRTCRAEGLREGAEIMCVIGDAAPGSASSSDSEDGDDSMDSGAIDVDGTVKRKRNRNKNKKKKGKKSPGTPASGTPSVPATPATPLDKLAAVSNILQRLLPECVQFTNNPPTDPAKKSYEHKRLSETILAQVLLKLDAVDTEGDPEARARRKELVKDAQRVLTGLDEANN